MKTKNLEQLEFDMQGMFSYMRSLQMSNTHMKEQLDALEAFVVERGGRGFTLISMLNDLFDTITRKNNE